MTALDLILLTTLVLLAVFWGACTIDAWLRPERWR